MSQVLLLELPESGPGAVNWLVWDREGERKIAGGSLKSLAQLSELQAYSRQYPCYALVPGELASCFKVTMPTAGRTAETALPFQVEELLCTDLDEQFIAHQKIVAGKAIDVLVVGKTLIEGWHQALQQADLRVQALVPDYLLLPDDCLLLDGSRALVNVGGHRATLDSDSLAVWWQLAESDREQASTPRILKTGDDALTLPEGMGAAELSGPRLSTLARLMAEPGLTLLQGDFTLRDPIRQLVMAIRWPAVAAVLVLLLHWVTLGVQIGVAKREQAQLDEAIATVYRATFPEARRVVNPRSQMRSQLLALQGSGADNRLLPWLDKAATALNQHPAIQLSQLNFQQQPQALKLVLDVPSYASIDGLSQALTASGVRVERGTFSQKGEGISGQLIIREATP